MREDRVESPCTQSIAAITYHPCSEEMVKIAAIFCPIVAPWQVSLGPTPQPAQIGAVYLCPVAGAFCVRRAVQAK